MPMYEFLEEESGEVIELALSLAEYDKRVKDGRITLDDGKTAVYDWRQHRLTKTLPANYPMVCTAAGVHPAQIQDHIEHLRQKGCGFVEHTKDGDVVFQDKAQRKRVCEALGLYDRNASYDDPQPKHRTASVRKFR